MKNDTRIASLLGTWTGQTHLKTDIGSYELMAYFAVHIMPDPMRGYACFLPDCKEEDNRACMQDEHGNPVCKNLADTVMDWSDVTAFMYFGARVDVGFPFNKHRAQDTGGWLGPINLILAQEQEKRIDVEEAPFYSSSSTIRKISSNGEQLVDRYVSRYVETPSTQFLHMPKNCTLLHEHDFQKLAGPEAVRSTAKGQYDPNHGSDDADYDPYAKYLKSCDNGEVKPMLPSMEFDFVKDTNSDDNNDENIAVKIKYKLLVVPKKTDYVYSLFPMIQRRFNKANFGFQIAGPYCYEEDPRRGYTFDLDFDSSDSSGFMKFEHACVEGLPCLPPAAELYVESQNSSIDVKPLPDNATTVGIRKYLLLGTVFFALNAMVLYLFYKNRILQRRLRQVGQQNEDANVSVEVPRATPSGNNDMNSSSEEEESLSTPYEAMEESISNSAASVADENVVEAPLDNEQDGNEGETQGLLSNPDGTDTVG